MLVRGEARLLCSTDQLPVFETSARLFCDERRASGTQKKREPDGRRS
jgi:hypothetical protein